MQVPLPDALAAAATKRAIRDGHEAVCAGS